jgi:hypothetical protein
MPVSRMPLCLCVTFGVVLAMKWARLSPIHIFRLPVSVFTRIRTRLESRWKIEPREEYEVGFRTNYWHFSLNWRATETSKCSSCELDRVQICAVNCRGTELSIHLHAQLSLARFNTPIKSLTVFTLNIWSPSYYINPLTLQVTGSCNGNLTP